MNKSLVGNVTKYHVTKAVDTEREIIALTLVKNLPKYFHLSDYSLPINHKGKPFNPYILPMCSEPKSHFYSKENQYKKWQKKSTPFT